MAVVQLDHLKEYTAGLDSLAEIHDYPSSWNDAALYCDLALDEQQ